MGLQRDPHESEWACKETQPQQGAALQVFLPDKHLHGRPLQGLARAYLTRKTQAATANEARPGSKHIGGVDTPLYANIHLPVQELLALTLAS